MNSKIEISHKTIIFTAFFIIFLWILLQIKDIIFLVFIAFIFMSAFKPAADSLEKFKIPRLLSIFIIYIFIITIFIFVGVAIVPPLVTETGHLAENLPQLLRKALPFVNIDQQLINQITPVGQNLIKFTLGIFNNLIAIFTVFVMSFYLLLERKYLEGHLSTFMGELASKKVIIIIKRIEEMLGAWVRGQVTLMFTIGVLTYIGLIILGIDYALPLALLAGLLEIVPTIGPILSAIPAILVALTVSPLFSLITAGLYLIVQQVENNLIVPFIMKTVIGMPPLLTIIAIMVGGKLEGLIGAILAVPVVVVIETIFTQYLKLNEEI